MQLINGKRYEITYTQGGVFKVNTATYFNHDFPHFIVLDKLIIMDSILKIDNQSRWLYIV